MHWRRPGNIEGFIKTKVHGGAYKPEFLAFFLPSHWLTAVRMCPLCVSMTASIRDCPRLACTPASGPVYPCTSPRCCNYPSKMSLALMWLRRQMEGHSETNGKGWRASRWPELQSYREKDVTYSTIDSEFRGKKSEMRVLNLIQWGESLKCEVWTQNSEKNEYELLSMSMDIVRICKIMMQDLKSI